MDESTLTQQIKAALSRVAPELEPGTLDPDINFRDQVDLDSVDFLNFVLELETRLRHRIPEVDYPKLSNLAGCIHYLLPLVNRSKASEP